MIALREGDGAVMREVLGEGEAGTAETAQTGSVHEHATGEAGDAHP